MGRPTISPDGIPMTATERSLRRYERNREAINRKRRTARKLARKRAKAGRRLSPGHNPPSCDVVQTPPPLAAEIVDAFRPTGRLLDPCRGAGAFYGALQRHSDNVDWCEVAEGRDFFQYYDPVDWIITNPPFSLFAPFLEHAMELAPNVAFLAPSVHFQTKARLRMIAATGFAVTKLMLVDTPPGWNLGGFQLAVGLAQRGGVSMFARLG